MTSFRQLTYIVTGGILDRRSTAEITGTYRRRALWDVGPEAGRRDAEGGSTRALWRGRERSLVPNGLRLAVGTVRYMDVRSSSRSLRGIPFQRRPWVGAVIAVVLFVAVFVLRLIVHGATDHITSLYVLPIALLAVAFGMRAGAYSGAAGVLLVAVWVWVDGVTLSPLGWFGRVVPLLLLGVLVGQAADRLRAAAATEEALFASRLREREAAEINDAIVQRLVAAKWSLEADQPDRGLEALTETIGTAESLVVALLRGDPFHDSPPKASNELDRDVRTAATR